MSAVAAEWRKLRSLPSALVAIGLTLVAMPALGMSTANRLAAQLDAGGGRVLGTVTTLTVGFELVPFAVLGPVVLGVVMIGSEYTRGSQDSGGGRQITASLTAVPVRGRLLLAKAVVLAGVSAALAVVVIPATIGLAQAALGAHGHTWAELAPRVAGAVAYWVLMPLIAFAVTVVTRSGIVPMVFFVVNSSFVSVTYLLTRVTPLAAYLPDMAGSRMFTGQGPVQGGLVMLAWTAGLLAVATLVFTRRDA